MIHTESFESILLKDMDQVKLMNRTDTKYCCNTSQLQSLFDKINQNYFILHIEGQSELPYSTTYFDTLDNKMFVAHQNGKLNRYKIRRRTYLSSDISFLEIKFKSNKGRTIKKRVSTDIHTTKFNAEENEFLRTHSPFNSDQLQSTLINEFSRITLVNKNFKERCTIDINLQFKVADKTIPLENLAIIEIKSDGNSSESHLAKALLDKRIKKFGISKYCIGRTVTDPNLKTNTFKPKVRYLEKTLNK